MKENRALRVIAVIPSEPEGAGFIFAKRQVDALEEAGVAVERFFLRSRLSPFVLMAELRRFRRIVRRSRPHIVHAHFGTMTAFFCAVATTAPLVITYRGSDVNPLRGAAWLRHWCARIMSQVALLRAAQVICVSAQVRSRLWRSRARTRAHVVPVGVNLKLFRLVAKSEARQTLGWNSNAKVVVFNAGRPFQRSNKRLDLAQAAVRAAEAGAGSIQLVVLDGLVPAERMPLVLNGADCLLVTSDYEGSPNVVKEAMACNLPVVSVDVGDVVERLRDVHPSGIVPRDPLALGGAISDILRSNQRSNGRDIVERDLSEAATIQKVLDVYREAIRTVSRAS